MIYNLSSKALSVNVSDKGAELQNILSSLSGKEYLWQGDPAVWGGRAPVLFPLIGASKNGKYSINGNVFAVPKHGFVRAAYFYRLDTGKNRISFEYRDNSFTRECYPFKFDFTVSFSLEGENGNVICVENRVENRSKDMMPFCLGAHEAYNCSPFEDCFLEFEMPDGLTELKSETVVLTNGLLSDERYSVPLNKNILPLDYSLFDKDTLVFKNVPCGKVSLKSKKSKDVVEVEFDAPNLAVWTKPGAEYICIEPWFGLPGYENGGTELSERPGAVCLPPGEEFVSKHRIKIN